MRAVVLVAVAWASAAAAQQDAGVAAEAPLRMAVRGPTSEYEALVAGLRRHPVQFTPDAEYVLEGLIATRRGKLQYELSLKHGHRVIWTRAGPMPSPGAELLGSEAGDALVKDWLAERRIDLAAVDVSYAQLRVISRALAALPNVREQKMWRYEARTADYDLLTQRTPHAGRLAQQLEALELDGHRFQATVVDETHLKIRILPPAAPDAGPQSTPSTP